MAEHNDGLPPLRDVIERYELNAKKNLGQNFLLDLNLTRRIARQAAPFDDVTIIEVGPGPGGLTRALLMEGAKKVIAIERDERTRPAHEEIARAYPGRIEFIYEDAMAVDYPALLDGEKARICANLPYNIATPLFTGWLNTPQWPPYFDRLVLMFQKEVAERITASHKDKAFGRLAVLSQMLGYATKAFDVHPSAFVPPPKVTSSIVVFEPKKDAPAQLRQEVERLTAAAFGQRRKMLRQSLKSVTKNPEALCAAVNVPATARAEEIPISIFIKMADILAAKA